MEKRVSRREFVQGATLAAGLTALGGVWTEGAAAQSKSPNEKLNIACVGIGGQGASDANNVSSENIVALCDVDEAYAGKTFAKYPDAKKYQDFRKMLEQKDVDAVVVSTPDHLHATITLAALQAGKHVYCQKPLTHNVYEARLVTDMAAKTKVATQMGTQGHAFEGYFRLVELVQTGAIGPIKEVHVWTDRPAGWWPQGIDRPKDTPPVPSTLNWDAWLGPAPLRPYNPAYLPFKWRGWWDFGTGAVGDMACHLMDPVFWALKLTYPLWVEANGTGGTAESPPVSSIIRYGFPGRAAQPSFVVTWYDGTNRPPADLWQGEKVPKIDNGSCFVGEKGTILINHGDNPILLPAMSYADYKPPTPFLKRSPGHHKEWILACKTGSPTGSHFGYAGPMTESILLGNVALRTKKRIEWDATTRTVTNTADADNYLKRKYRKGWML